MIADIALAPRNPQGRVEALANVVILRPADPARGSGTLLLDVPNRGRKLTAQRSEDSGTDRRRVFNRVQTNAIRGAMRRAVRGGSPRGRSPASMDNVRLNTAPFHLVRHHHLQALQPVRRVRKSCLGAAPQAPAWLASLPISGERLASLWDQATHAEGGIRGVLAPYSAVLREAFVGAAGALAESVLQIFLSLIVATTFWVSGDTLVAALPDTRPS